jgi:hypothetical protein
MKIRMTTDGEASATYLYLNEGTPVARTECLEGEPMTNLDLSAEGTLVGVEVLELPKAFVWNEIGRGSEERSLVVNVGMDTVANVTRVSVGSRGKSVRETETPNGARLLWDAEGNLLEVVMPGLPKTVVVGDATRRFHDLTKS